MVGAGGREEERLGLRTPSVLVASEEEVANPFGAFASPRLARFDDVDAALAQGRGERLDLSRLARALSAFEADKSPARGRGGAHAIRRVA